MFDWHTKQIERVDRLHHALQPIMEVIEHGEWILSDEVRNIVNRDAGMMKFVERHKFRPTEMSCFQKPQENKKITLQERDSTSSRWLADRIV